MLGHNAGDKAGNQQEWVEAGAGNLERDWALNLKGFVLLLFSCLLRASHLQWSLLAVASSHIGFGFKRWGVAKGVYIIVGQRGQ